MTTPIRKLACTITDVRDLTPTARELVLNLPEPLIFTAGNFVNLFLPHDGTMMRRAFSISSADTDTDHISLSIRLSPEGEMTPLFWENNYLGTRVGLMGPMGLNTADKIVSKNIFLFGFGIGAGVIKSLAAHITTYNEFESLTIMTGNRSENEIVHKDFFDALAGKDSRIKVRYVISQEDVETPYVAGYIQDHVNDCDFNNADVYVCGQKIACDALVKTIKSLPPRCCTFFIEDFG